MAPKDNTVAMLSLSKCLILVCTHKLFHLRAVVQEQVPLAVQSLISREIGKVRYSTRENNNWVSLKPQR